MVSTVSCLHLVILANVYGVVVVNFIFKLLVERALDPESLEERNWHCLVSYDEPR